MLDGYNNCKFYFNCKKIRSHISVERYNHYFLAKCSVFSITSPLSLFSLKLFFYKSRVTDFSMLQYNEIRSVILFEHIIFLPKDRFSLKDLTGYWDEKAQVSIIHRISSFTSGDSFDNKAFNSSIDGTISPIPS